jgi:hypothetical protein
MESIEVNALNKLGGGLFDDVCDDDDFSMVFTFLFRTCIHDI